MKTMKLAMLGGLLAGALIIPAKSVIAGDHGKLHIPPGHLPPPGQCRIWYPGTPPGHQPPPGDCRLLSRRLPAGAWLVSRDRIWRYDERPYYHYHRPYASTDRPDWRDDHRYPRGVYDRGRYSSRYEVGQSIKDVREARKNVREDRDQLEKNRDELKKDRAELKKDIRSGASQKEIRQDRREIRDDRQKIAASQQELRQSQRKLSEARQDLRQDLRNR